MTLDPSLILTGESRLIRRLLALKDKLGKGNDDIVRDAVTEIAALRQSLARVVDAVQRHQPAGSPPPGDELVLVEWILAAVTGESRQEETMEHAMSGHPYIHIDGSPEPCDYEQAGGSRCVNDAHYRYPTAVEWQKHAASAVALKQLTEERNTLRTALLAELRKAPKYWVRVATSPMDRSVPCVMWVDVERAIAATLATGEDQS